VKPAPRMPSKGQVTIPMGIRRKLALKEGDKVIFPEKGGDVTLANSNRLASAGFGRERMRGGERQVSPASRT